MPTPWDIEIAERYGEDPSTEYHRCDHCGEYVTGDGYRECDGCGDGCCDGCCVGDYCVGCKESDDEES